MQVLNYGGGRQTIAICVLIAKEVLPRPDRIVMADTGREKQSSFDYLNTHIQPLLAPLGLQVEIAPRSLAYVDLYSHLGTMLMPVYTPTGKFSALCSGEWKARVVGRFLGGSDKRRVHWIGFSYDERKRIKSREGKWFPLVERLLTNVDCGEITQRAGLPPAPRSACWMCPNMGNAEWREIRDNRPSEFEAACVIDEEVREEDRANGGGGMWLHESRVPLRDAPIHLPDRNEPSRQCGLGLCMV
jgi:hypothetical protein